MYLILNTHSSSEHYNGDCDYAVVDLTTALAEQIRRRVALAREAGQQDDDLYEMHFWGSTADFYDDGILDTCQDAVAATADASDPEQAAADWLTDFERREYAVLPDGIDLDAHEAQRIECDRMVIRVASYSGLLEFVVVWKAIPKHSDVSVTTSELSLTVMEELLAETNSKGTT